MALTLSNAIPYAGDWLHLVPSPALGLHLHDQELHHCLQYWLGVRMLEEGSRCATVGVADTGSITIIH